MTGDEADQTVVADSFAALYRDARGRITTSRAALAARHEFCEDMATLLVERCGTMAFRDDLGETEVLRRCLDGLLATPSVLDAAEAVWVVHRTAELLAWPFDAERLTAG